MRKQAGNMYPFVTHTWNPIKGRCSHDCVYCYMKQFKLNPIRIDTRELNEDLGEDHFVFVGSSTDMWARDVPKHWIAAVLVRVERFPGNRYLFQSKSPGRFLGFRTVPDAIYGTTIETNRSGVMLSNAPPVAARAAVLGDMASRGIPTMVTIEPIVNFDLDEMVALMLLARPAWVNIGADSKGHDLSEPSADKVRALIAALQPVTEVKIKANLSRILEGV